MLSDISFINYNHDIRVYCFDLRAGRGDDDGDDGWQKYILCYIVSGKREDGRWEDIFFLFPWLPDGVQGSGQIHPIILQYRFQQRPPAVV